MNNKKDTDTNNKQSNKKAKKIVKLTALKIGELSGYTCISIGIIMAILILTTYKF